MTDTLPVATPSPAKPRVLWVDYAKGLSIFLVVVYHVWNGIMRRPDRIPAPADIYEPINRTFEMVRMPLFFFVSGLFVGRSAQKSVGRFVADKLRTIAWPYLVWSCVYVIALLVLAKASHSAPATPLRELPYALAVAPVAQFWFLYVLFMALMLFLLLVKLRIPTPGIVLVGVTLILVKLNVPFDRVAIDVGAYHISPARWWPIFQLFNFFIYMSLGAILAPFLLQRMDEQKSPALAFLAIVTAAIVLVSVLNFQLYRDAAAAVGALKVPSGLPVALCSVAGALCVAVLLQRGGFAKFVKTMGQYSLYIFVLHVLFTAGLRAALLKAGVNSFAVHMIVEIPFAVIAPIVVAVIAQKLKLEWLFRLKDA